MPSFSLLVPTWNNLAHLRLFVESLRELPAEYPAVLEGEEPGRPVPIELKLKH